MGMALRIRPLQSEDAERVAMLDAACAFSAHWPATAYAMQKDGFLQGWVAATPANPESLRGFIAVRCAADEMEILNLAVLPESRRQGIARTLLDATVANVRDRDLHRIYLEVREANDAAIAFYRAMGFYQIGRRSKYYSGPVDDALVFVRVLSDSSGSSRR
jgi:ribosomal-protein-alanine N-acetyltransferase